MWVVLQKNMAWSWFVIKHLLHCACFIAHSREGVSWNWRVPSQVQWKRHDAIDSERCWYACKGKMCPHCRWDQFIAFKKTPDMIVPDALILLFDLHVSVEVALLFHRWIQSSIMIEDPLSLSLPFCVLKIFSHPLTRCHHHNQRHGHLPCHNEVITTFLM